MRRAPCGTRSAYVGGCHCDACTEANRVYGQQWRGRRLDQGWRIVRGRWTRP